MVTPWVYDTSWYIFSNYFLILFKSCSPAFLIVTSDFVNQSILWKSTGFHMIHNHGGGYILTLAASPRLDRDHAAFGRLCKGGARDIMGRIFRDTRLGESGSTKSVVLHCVIVLQSFGIFVWKVAHLLHLLHLLFFFGSIWDSQGSEKWGIYPVVWREPRSYGYSNSLSNEERRSYQEFPNHMQGISRNIFMGSASYVLCTKGDKYLSLI